MPGPGEMENSHRILDGCQWGLTATKPSWREPLTYGLTAIVDPNSQLGTKMDSMLTSNDSNHAFFVPSTSSSDLMIIQHQQATESIHGS